MAAEKQAEYYQLRVDDTDHVVLTSRTGVEYEFPYRLDLQTSCFLAVVDLLRRSAVEGQIGVFVIPSEAAVEALKRRWLSFPAETPETVANEVREANDWLRRCSHLSRFEFGEYRPQSSKTRYQYKIHGTEPFKPKSNRPRSAFVD